MLRRYLLRFAKWGRYATGRSYQHVPQPLGRHYTPGRLQGYFNDLGKKATWPGELDSAGVPVVSTDTRSRFHFPIVIFQWGLAHWDLLLDGGPLETEHRQCFLRAATWARDNQEVSGGWECWTGLERPVSTAYSAMAQGEGISLLLRGHQLTGDDSYLRAAANAYHFMWEPRAELVSQRGGIKILEEYPGGELPGVLNGWMFALFGAHEFSLQAADSQVDTQVNELASSLVACLPRFDTGFWSLYDLGGNLASPFYHDLHIAQLRAMSLALPSFKDAFTARADTFERYRRSRLCLARAVGIKVFQKLRQAETGEMR